MDASYCASLGGMLQDDDANANRKRCYLNGTVSDSTFQFAGNETDLDALTPVDGKLNYNELKEQCKTHDTALFKNELKGTYECPSHFDIINKLVTNTPEMQKEKQLQAETEQKKQYLIYGGGAAAALCVCSVCCISVIVMMRR